MGIFDRVSPPPPDNRSRLAQFASQCSDRSSSVNRQLSTSTGFDEDNDSIELALSARLANDDDQMMPCTPPANFRPPAFNNIRNRDDDEDSLTNHQVRSHVRAAPRARASRSSSETPTPQDPTPLGNGRNQNVQEVIADFIEELVFTLASKATGYCDVNELRTDFAKDTGYIPEMQVVKFGYPTFEVFLESKPMEKYVTTKLIDGKVFWMPRDFSKFEHIRSEQEIAQYADLKMMEREEQNKIARALLKNNLPQTIEGRRRLARCAHELGAGPNGKPANWQDIQKKYFELYKVDLNGEELKKHFMRDKALRIVETLCEPELEVFLGNMPGHFFLRLKHPINEINSKLSDDKRVRAEAEEMLVRNNVQLAATGPQRDPSNGRERGTGFGGAAKKKKDIYPVGMPERQETTNNAMDFFDGTVPSTSAAAGIAPITNANSNTKPKFHLPPNAQPIKQMGAEMMEGQPPDTESQLRDIWGDEDPVESYNAHLQQNSGGNGNAQQQQQGGGNKTAKPKTKYTSCDADMTDSEADSDDENTEMDAPTGRNTTQPANNANGGTTASNVPLLPSAGLSCHTRVLQEFMGGKIAEQRKNGTVGTGPKQAQQQQQRKPAVQIPTRNEAFQPQYGDSSEDEDDGATLTGHSVSNQQQQNSQSGVQQVQQANNGIGTGGNKLSAYTQLSRPTVGLGSAPVPNSAYNPLPPLASMNNSAAFNRVPVIPTARPPPSVHSVSTLGGNPVPVAPPSLMNSQQFAPIQPMAGQWTLMSHVEQMREMANGMQLSHENRPDEGSFTFRHGNLLLTFAEFEDKLRGSIYSHGKIIDERYYIKVDWDMFRLTMLGAIQQVFFQPNAAANREHPVFADDTNMNGGFFNSNRTNSQWGCPPEGAMPVRASGGGNNGNGFQRNNSNNQNQQSVQPNNPQWNRRQSQSQQHRNNYYQEEEEGDQPEHNNVNGFQHNNHQSVQPYNPQWNRRQSQSQQHEQHRNNYYQEEEEDDQPEHNNVNGFQHNYNQNRHSVEPYNPQWNRRQSHQNRNNYYQEEDEEQEHQNESDHFFDESDHGWPAQAQQADNEMEQSWQSGSSGWGAPPLPQAVQEYAENPPTAPRMVDRPHFCLEAVPECCRLCSPIRVQQHGRQ